MKALLVCGLATVVLAVALSTGWDLMFRLFYTMAGVLCISLVWAWVNVRQLRFSHEVKTTRAAVGGHIEERLCLENTSWLPKLWLEIRDHSTLAGRRGNRVVALSGHAKRSFTLVTPCTVRGEFALGPITVASGDPFGLFRLERLLNVGGKVIVHPSTVRLLSFVKLPGELPGGNAQMERTHHATPNAATVRDYQPGDAMSRIHWLSSARHGRLLVKEFDLDPLSDVWLVLDLDREVQVGSGEDSTEEWAVSACASLASHFIGQQRQVGLVTQGAVLTADRGHRQLMKLLDLLAVVRSDSSVALEEVVLSEEVRFRRGATAVIITPSTDERLLDTCRLLASRRVSVVVVLLEASTFGARRSSLLLVSSLAADGVPTYLVKHGDDLARALVRPNGGVGRGV